MGRKPTQEEIHEAIQDHLDDEPDADDEWCSHCNGTGEKDCYCGGDLCVCDNFGTYPCPYCQHWGGPMTEEHTTRRAPHMERYTEIKPVLVQDEPDAHLLVLKIGNQSFHMDSGAGHYETKADAEWARDMLCIALDQIVRDHAEK